jgi:hypothetical protein
MLVAVLIIGLLVGLSIAAIILTSACTLVRVPQPDFFFAMILCFVVGTVLFGLQFLAGVAGTVSAGVSLTTLKTVSGFQHLMERGAMMSLFSTPFVSAGIYSIALRECSFLRGLLVWAAQFVVVIGFALIIYAAISGLGLAVRPS